MFLLDVDDFVFGMIKTGEDAVFVYYTAFSVTPRFEYLDNLLMFPDAGI
jgi:hypothetical protein